MANKMFHLIFPQKLIRKPIIYTISKKYSIVPNIRKANITETIGEVTLQFTGEKTDLDKAEKYLKRIGVKIEPVIGDYLE